jgi:hypothetical protein
MPTLKFDASLFARYAEKVKKELSLLDDFELPSGKKWTIDWEQIKAIEQSSKRNRWNELPIYKELLANKNSPAIYFFMVNKKESKYLFELFAEGKDESSRISREKGVKEKGFKRISQVPKYFHESNCMYVGSRKTKINERFKQHLGYGSGRTGALHMASVFSLKSTIPDVTFHYHILDEKYVRLTEDIECVIQNKLKPFIGKNILGD